MTEHTCNLSVEQVEQEDQDFMVILRYIKLCPEFPVQWDLPSPKGPRGDRD